MRENCVFYKNFSTAFKTESIAKQKKLTRIECFFKFYWTVYMPEESAPDFGYVSVIYPKHFRANLL